MLKRKAKATLEQWKNAEHKKCLIVQGAPGRFWELITKGPLPILSVMWII